MRLPTVEDVNAYRVAKFNEAIGQALGDPQVGLFRDLVAAYEAEHDVPAVDIAAAIAVLAQDGEPLLLEEAPEPIRAARDQRAGVRRPMAPYRIEVGRKQRVEPRQIVGALANEGGLSLEDFGKIDIRPAFSIVELPADLTAETLDALADTRIGGVLIDLKPDRFARNRSARPGADRPRHDTRKAPGGKKPRHKKG
jgi:ATP-dependent RNA helicase DeaD